MQKVYQCELSELFPDADDKKPLPDGMDFVVRDLLYCLGVTEKYVGFPHTLYAVRLSIQQPERLMLVTKWLYPDVAKQYHTSWQNVEKNIRNYSDHCLAASSGYSVFPCQPHVRTQAKQYRIHFYLGTLSERPRQQNRDSAFRTDFVVFINRRYSFWLYRLLI